MARPGGKKTASEFQELSGQPLACRVHDGDLGTSPARVRGPWDELRIIHISPPNKRASITRSGPTCTLTRTTCCHSTQRGAQAARNRRASRTRKRGRAQLLRASRAHNMCVQEGKTATLDFALEMIKTVPSPKPGAVLYHDSGQLKPSLSSPLSRAPSPGSSTPAAGERHAWSGFSSRFGSLQEAPYSILLAAQVSVGAKESASAAGT